MKRVKQNFKKRTRKLIEEDRRGSTIVIVIALLSSLMILGFFFFSLASQENENAEYFKEAAKEIDPIEIDPDELFDCFLQQLILGAEPHQYNSVFYGGRYSFLPTMFGTDLSPFNGEGVNAVWDTANGYPSADLNYNGTSDVLDGLLDPEAALEINQIPGAQLTAGQNAEDTTIASNDLVNNNRRWIPEPDVGYVYPDHNFPFMTYIGYAPNLTTGVEEEVLIPAGHRPQLLRNRALPAAWYTDGTTQGWSFRAHQERLAVTENGTVSSNTRFISGTHPSTSTPAVLDYFTNSGFPGTLSEGVWSGNAGYTYEADPAGRGFNSAIYMDCDFPPIRDRNTGQVYVPLIAAEILDAEGLLNLNVIGNVNATLTSGATNINTMPTATSLSQSNAGNSPLEINPYYALLTDPSTENTTLSTPSPYEFEDYNEYFRFTTTYSSTTPPPTNLVANADWWSILKGAPKISSSEVIEVYPGRYGEPELARIAWEGGTPSYNAFPFAGVTGVDDNFNQALNNFPFVSTTTPARYAPLPVDYFGVGDREVTGKQREILLADLRRFASFSGYAVNDIPYRNHYGFTPMPGSTSAGGIALRDDSEEMIVDPSLASEFTFDSPFSPAESAGLYLGNNDFTNTGTTSLLREAAPWSFRENDRAELIRRRFTTISHDLKSYAFHLFGSNSADNGAPYTSVPDPRNRLWEWNDNDGDGLLEFPRLIDLVAPGGIDSNDYVSNTQPIRYALYTLLYQEEGDSTALKLMRKLNVNGITEFDRDLTATGQTGYLRQRGLVPHSTGLTATPLVTQLGGAIPQRNQYQAFVNTVIGANTLPTLNTVTLPGTTASQEFVARIDRQTLARDIYTLLYLYGHGNDDISSNTFSTSNAGPGYALYSLEECREMAQFAVNLVDNMDPDDVITKFEYDTNLANGWQLDDYPYDITTTGWGDTAGAERQVVYGVEEQQLSFNEAAAVFAKEVRQDTSNPGSMKRDHNWTEWDDQQHHAFLFMELQTTAGRSVTFGNDAWEIVVLPKEWSGTDPDTEAGTLAGPERHVIISDPGTNLTIGTNASNYTLSLGTVCNETDTAFNFPSQGSPGPARMRITGGSAFDVYPVIDSTASPSDDRFIDLTNENSSPSVQFKIYDESTNTMLESSSEPEGQRLLNFTNWDDIYNNVGAGSGAKDIEIELVLRRRADPTRVAPDMTDAAQNDDNPWVVMDRIQVPLNALELGYGDTAFTDAQFDAGLSSYSRFQPLYGVHDNDNITSVPSFSGSGTYQYSFNSIGATNRDSGGDVSAYSLWHPHKNHEYHSLVDLFSVPLFGPDELDGPVAPLSDDDTGTARLDPDPSTGNGPWRGLTSKLGEVIGGGTAEGALLAGRDTFGHKVLNPWGEDGDPSPPTSGSPLERNNRWHRVLALLDAPTRIHQSISPDGLTRIDPGALGFFDQIGSVGGLQTLLYRQPGVLNLNTIRDPEVLAGLMDDPTVFSFNPLGTNLPELNDLAGAQTNPFDGSATGFYDGDWWKMFAFSRDGLDPIQEAAGNLVALPGVGGVSRPFRSLDLSAHALTGNQVSHSIEHTILRTMPDPDPTASPRNAESTADNPRGRQLFELGTKGEHDSYNLNGQAIGSIGYNALDYDYKYRMLKKVMNNSTLRSNTFFVFLQADLFEAEFAPDGAVRIGAKIANSPGYRGFFIIDRTKAMELVQRTDIPNKRNARSFSFNPNFNWRALLLHRQRLN